MQTQTSTNVGVLKAAILGAVAGATAVALTQKDIQKKIKSTTKSLLSKAEKKIDEVKKEGKNLKDETLEKLKDIDLNQ